jgi:GT2 family glycosyltransferase
VSFGSSITFLRDRPAPDTTVVVITRDRRETLLRTLGHLLGLPSRPPVIVVDNASGDDTLQAVRARHPQVRLVPLGENRGAAARDEGIRLARTPYVALCDDDSWWAPDALGRAAGHLRRHPRLGLVAARVLVGPEERLDPTCEAMAVSPLPDAPGLPGPRVLGFVACGAVVRRRAAIQGVGTAPLRGMGGEEALVAIDLEVAGWKLVYAPDVVAYHHPPADYARDARCATTRANDLRVALLRRAPSTVLARIASGEARTMTQLIPEVPGLLRARRRVPPGLERDLRLLRTAR